MSPDSIAPWRLLKEERLLTTHRLSITKDTVQTPDGVIIDDYLQIHMGEASVIAATDPDGHYIVQRLYKHGARKIGLGFPGGGVEANETALAAAQRELLEETGMKADGWRSLGVYAVHSNQGAGTVSFFSAQNATIVQSPSGGDLEQQEMLRMPRAQVLGAIRRQEFLSMGHVCLAAMALLAEAEI